MCGFAGFCDENEKSEQLKMKIVGEMTEKIRHRGPDDTGVYCDDFVTLGFARLKILDLQNGAQPMISRDGRYVLCFNGEIYNYLDLREEMAKKFSEKFYTESDTEVLLYLLIHYGERALEKLRGMFAFAFYDREEKRLLMARDPFGIKPLYYGVFDGVLMFASEIKAFLAHPKFKKRFDDELLPYYLQFQYVPTEKTAFCGVKRLMPGHLLTYSDGQLTVEKWFDMPIFEKNGYIGYTFFSERDGAKRNLMPYKKSATVISKRLGEVLQHVTERHMRADVKIGGFLSGGVDSGLICAYAKPKIAFTVGFRDCGFDERACAIRTAEELNIPLASLEVNADDFFECVDAVQYYSDEPYANLSAVPLYLLSKKAKESVGVVLSGEGADELFGGYDWYKDSFVGKIYRKLPQSARKKAAKRALAGRTGDFIRRNAGIAEKEFIGQARIMQDFEAYELLSAPYKRLKNPLAITEPIYNVSPNASDLRRKMHLDAHLWLPFDILNKADKMTMASSLELRVPYLDLSVLSLAEGCSDRLLMRGKTSKYLLRKAAESRLPSDVARRAKKGFPVPFREWIRERKYAEILEKAFTGEIGKRFFDTSKLLTMLGEHRKGEKNNARVLYTVYAFIVWYEVFFEKEVQSTVIMDTAEIERETENMQTNAPVTAESSIDGEKAITQEK